jgi:glycosyltransferase involved in cell wall biosynthesis
VRFLVACYDYPRPGAPGANRWVAMGKYLRRLGHEVTVLTAVSPGSSPGEADGVLRTPDLNSNRALRRLLRRPAVGAAPAGASGPPAGAAGASVRPSALLTQVVVPDAYLLSWLPWAYREVNRLLRREQVDCLITSGPPHSTHLLGLALRARRPPWIAEFRDGWVFEPPHDPLPTAPQLALDRWFERRVASRADAVVAVTQPIVDDFRARLGVHAELVSNGWDPELTGSGSPAGGNEKFTFMHTGTTTGGSGRDPRPLLAAVRVLRDEDPALAARAEFLFAGMSSSEDLELLGGPGLDGIVRYLGFVAREQAIELQRQADALLLLTSDRISEATMKLFEYLGAGRPILALAENNEAARIVTQTGTGVCVPPRDVRAIAAQLRGALEGRLKQSYAPHELEPYRYPGPAERMADVASRIAAGAVGRSG